MVQQPTREACLRFGDKSPVEGIAFNESKSCCVLAVAAAEYAKQQLAVMQKQLDALLKLQALGVGSRMGATYGQLQSAASGGDWRVNGAPGQDMNVIPMALSHGELVSVTPPGQSVPQGGAGGGDVHIHAGAIAISTPNIASFKQSRAQIVARVASMVASATANRTTKPR